MKDKKAKWCLIIIVSILVGFGGLTAEDHNSYELIFSNPVSYLSEFSLTSLFSDSKSFESGFLLLNIICNFLGLGYAGYFCVAAIITNALMIFSIYKYKRPALSFFVVYFLAIFLFQQTNLLRQCMALSIVTFVINDLVRGNIKKYIIGVVLAAQFHMSAYIFLFLCVAKPLNTINNDKILFILRVGLLFLVTCSLLIGLGFLNFDILNLLNFVTSYDKYVVDERPVGLSVNYVIVLLLNIPAYLILLRQKWFCQNYVYILAISAASISINIGMQYEFFMRISYYFQPLAYLFFVQYIDNIYEQKQLCLNKKILIRKKSIPFILLQIILLGFVWCYSIYVISFDYIFTSHPKVFDEVYNLNDFFGKY